MNKPLAKGVRLYRIIRAFSDCLALRVVLLDRVEDAVDKNYIDGAWACLEAIEKQLRRGDIDQQNIAVMIRETLYPEWDK